MSLGENENRQSGFARFVDRVDDGVIMRWSFRALLAGAVAVLALDLHGLVGSHAAIPNATPGGAMQPILPPAVDAPGSTTPGADPRRHVTTDETMLRHPMVFELAGDGVLLARGSIDQGASQRFRAELEARGEYIRTVQLDSPGGALDDAMAMGRLIRDRGYATEVADGALCASSCPLIFAAGERRVAGEKAAIGLHQFFAATGTLLEPAQVMADAQMTTARISRYLTDMDVDPALWLHALDTPPRSLYYLSPEEMQRYALVTPGSVAITR